MDMVSRRRNPGATFFASHRGSSVLRVFTEGMEPAGVEPASANRSLSASTCVFRRSNLAPPSAGGQPLGSQPRCVSLVRAEAARTCQPDLIDAADHASGRARSETGCEKAKPYAASAMLVLALVSFAAD